MRARTAAASATIFAIAGATHWSPAPGADWRLVSTDPEGSLYFVDYSSLVRSNQYVTAWIRGDYVKPQKGSTNSFRSLKLLYAVDCEKDLGAILSSVAYAEPGGGGEVVGENNSVTPMEPIPRGSILANFQVEVCKAPKRSNSETRERSRGSAPR